MFTLPLLSLLIATTAFAAASPCQCGERTVPSSALPLPANQTQLIAPNATAADFVLLGLGTQNYSCTVAGTYTPLGSNAQMLDISTLFGTSEFDRIQDCTYDFWSNYEGTNPYDYDLAIRLFLKFRLDIVGQYYFINDANGTLSPKFDFTNSGPTAGNPEAFVIGTKIADTPAPTGSQDIDWVEVEGLSGDFAKEIFRVRTRAGQPPPSCTPGSSDIEVKYTSQYWFFGSTLNQSTSSY
ncbi:hypothetical protein EI94DRAFT_1074979 [Lactarius quietus]|nr:hypothetical protein EI94DRAFT_1074979 [Lactarius quietus]